MARKDYYTNVNKQSEIYSDILTNFNAHPNTKQLVRNTNVDAVKRALRNLVLTNKYERPYNPDFGGRLRNFLFEPITPNIHLSIKEEIERMIENYEKRVRLLNVVVNVFPDESAFAITIIFSIKTSPQPVQLDLTLDRIR